MMSLTVSLTRVLALSPICAVNRSRRLQCSRRFSTSTLPPSIQRFTHELANQQPCFAMSASGVSILTEPRQFYQILLVSRLIYPACLPTGMRVQDMIRRARRRLFISSLYIGSEDLELVRVIPRCTNRKIHILSSGEGLRVVSTSEPVTTYLHASGLQPVYPARASVHGEHATTSAKAIP